MAQNNQTVLIAKNLSDVFYHMGSVNALKILGGCSWEKDINEKCLSICSIKELCSIEKKERYIDIGAGVKIRQLISFGEKFIPEVLYSALISIGTPQVKNMGTIGGNICAEGHRLTLFGPLLSLDARLEFRNESDTKYVPMSKFTEVPQGFLLTKIRVPYNEWDIQIFKRLGPSSTINELSATYTFLAEDQNDILSNIRFSFAGAKSFRSFELEDRLIGSRLPLSQKTINSIITSADEFFEEEKVDSTPNKIQKVQFLNLLKYSLSKLG